MVNTTQICFFSFLDVWKKVTTFCWNFLSSVVDFLNSCFFLTVHLWWELRWQIHHYGGVSVKNSSVLSTSAWVLKRLKKKKNELCYSSIQKKLQYYISGSELLTIPVALEAVTTGTFSLLTTDVKPRKRVGGAIKRIQIKPKLLAKTRHAMWDIMLATKELTKRSVRNMLTKKDVRL